MKHTVIILTLLLSFSFIQQGNAASVTPADQRAIKKTLLRARYYIKKGNYSKAILNIDFSSMAAIAMDGFWEKMSAGEKRKTIVFMKNLVREKFPVITKRLKHLKFGKITKMGDIALCETVVVFDRTVENKDQKIHIGLKKVQGRWKGVEVYILMEGFLEGLNEDKIKPILKRGGTIQEAMSVIRMEFSQDK